MVKVARNIILLLVVVALFSTNVDCRHRRRYKRRLDEFAKMISLQTEINPLDFNGYGHWCGLGGKGTTVDGIDHCCKVHDLCYGRVNRNECKTMLKYKVYTTDYRWQQYKGKITCKDDEICPKTICACDREAAMCFGRHKNIYDKANKHSAVLRGLKNLVGLGPKEQ